MINAIILLIFSILNVFLIVLGGLGIIDRYVPPLLYINGIILVIDSIIIFSHKKNKRDKK